MIGAKEPYAITSGSSSEKPLITGLSSSSGKEKDFVGQLLRVLPRIPITRGGIYVGTKMVLDKERTTVLIDCVDLQIPLRI